MRFTMGIEETSEFKKFLEMDPKQFDKYMCKTYPKLFDQRKLPMSQTCMCWGFSIGKGWYFYLDEMCKKLEIIRQVTKIRTSFSQIKEKFGSGRFYHDIKYGFSTWYEPPSKYFLIRIIKEILYKIINIIFYRMSQKKLKQWAEVIDDTISYYEEKVGYICEETGKQIDKPIDIGNWTYPMSEEGFLKVHEDRKEELKEWKQYEKEKEEINDAILDLDDKGINELKKFLKSYERK